MFIKIIQELWNVGSFLFLENTYLAAVHDVEL